MDQTYLKEHMCEELQGAEEYIIRAIEIKAMDPTWGKMFYEMSIEELKHAQNFYTMAKDYYSKVTSVYSTPPIYMEKCMNEIIEIFTERYATVKTMQGMYSM